MAVRTSNDLKRESAISRGIHQVGMQVAQTVHTVIDSVTGKHKDPALRYLERGILPVTETKKTEVQTQPLPEGHDPLATFLDEGIKPVTTENTIELHDFNSEEGRLS